MTYKTQVKALEKLKQDIVQMIFSAGEELENRVYDFSELLWTNIDDLNTSDLTIYSEVHEYLITEVTKIHNDEKVQYIGDALNTSLNIKTLMKELIEGKSEKNIYILKKEREYFLVGDIHSDTISLNAVLKSVDFFNNIINMKDFRLIFLGDYVDRGTAHLKIMERILTLKYLFPDHIILLRGNHDGGILNEDRTITLPYRKPEEDSADSYFPLYLKNLSTVNSTFNPILLEKYLQFFNTLGAMVFIQYGSKIALGVHGGIPRPRWDGTSYYSYLASINDLTNETIKDNIGKSIVNNMLWSDPHDGQADLKENMGRFYFTEDHFYDFRTNLGIDIIVRGHQAVVDGITTHFNDGVYTIFSSGDKHIDMKPNCETAYVGISPKVLELCPNGKIIELSL